ncbi:cobyrinate a,c-diamide synthase [Carboxylicivirga sp. M1479]|uniref:cobyrinate a,c-diamide synthase n=1 Tax=Carboxylicivirga sp. M1479 TaxID=2594476 RepID=UPI001177B725|nr:cobyrinate a,c-diamide synthase [Carboxylicivirga sp. M1479]TRX71705.1 cobyrinate a,c-diamide synthase [Carboxylicivirga sp. M1479]
MKHSFLIAAPSSNSGKTIVTLGLIKALRDKNFNIQAFKCGPDYIDPLQHSKIAGAKSYNLDVWMSDKEHIQQIYKQKMQNADVGIVEGVMGLFDGAKRDKGSSAEIAQALELPIVLVVNAAATAYSVAPLLYGFKNFNPDVKVKAVIFNKVSGDSHYQFLKEAAEDAGVESLGYVPKNEDLILESRHLGLSLSDNLHMQKAVDVAADLINRHVDLDELLSISETSISKQENVSAQKNTGLRFGIANDEAFNFMYPANIDCLKQLGELIYFSPLIDSVIPKCDILWFPGGYPELYAKELAANSSMIQSIQKFEQEGGKLLAECGGMMYLGKSVELQDGTSHSMLGVFNYSTSLKNMKLKLGYRSVWADDVEFKGHEFHYSLISEDDNQKADYPCKSARGKEVDMPIYKSKNAWSSYFHIYLGEIEKMKAFIDLLIDE